MNYDEIDAKEFEENVSGALANVLNEREKNPSFMPTLSFLQRRMVWGYTRASKVLPEVINRMEAMQADAPNRAEDGGWRLITSAPKDGKVLLTIHAKDLFPVCAFCLMEYGQERWFRQIEGPEDVVRPGALELLYRRPTHWRPIPEPPSAEAGGE